MLGIHIENKNGCVALLNLGVPQCIRRILRGNSTSRRIIQDRKALRARLKATLKPGASMVQLERAKTILKSLKETYTALDDASLVPRLESWDPYFALGVALFEKAKLADGLEMQLRGLEALVFIITASPPRIVREKNQKVSTLEIRRWGHSNEYVASSFLNIIQAYATLAPQICMIAKEYARISYSICYGEFETISTLDPQLCNYV
jgi:hypothetical protein